MRHYIYCYSFFIYIVATILLPTKIVSTDYNIVFLLYIILIVLGGGILFNKRINGIKECVTNGVLKSLNIFLLYLFIHYILGLIKGTPQITFIFLSQAGWICVANVYYVIGKYNDFASDYEKKMAYLCLSLMSYILIRQINLYSNLLEVLTESSGTSEFININPYLLSVLTIPLFFIKNKGIVALSALGIITGILITGKRGPLLSIIVALIGVGILKKGLLSKVKFFIIALIIFYFVISFLNYQYPEAITYLSERLIEDDTENMGSGRIGAWSKGLSIWSNLGIGTMIFGMGAGTINSLMSKAWGLDVGAHSDFFDVLFQYGLIGLFMQINYCIKMMHNVIYSKNLVYLNMIRYIGFYIIISMCYTMTYSSPSSIFYSSFFFYVLGRTKNRNR